MSSSEAEPLEPRQHMIGDEWEDFDTILEGLSEGTESPVEKYDHVDNTTELINYVAENLEVNEDDLERVQTEIANDKCPYCEEDYLEAITGNADISDKVDPTLAKKNWTTTEDSYREDADERIGFHFYAGCDEHPDAFMLYEETTHQ